jgi:puromycin-sensitive aminopeptidase
VAARHGDAQLYSQYKAQMQKATSPEQYYSYFYSLPEFPQAELVKETLDAVLTDQVRGQDLYLFIPLLQNPTSQNATWDFMRTHFDQLMAKTGGGLGGVGIFLYGAQAFCSTEKASQVKEFFQQHPFPGTERNQRETVENIDSCVELRDQQQSNLSAWLKQQGGVTNASAGAEGTTTGASAR